MLSSNGRWTEWHTDKTKFARWYIGNSEFFSSMYVTINFFNSTSVGPTIGQINKCTFSIQVVSVHFIDLAMRDIVLSSNWYYIAEEIDGQTMLLLWKCKWKQNSKNQCSSSYHIAPSYSCTNALQFPQKNPACTCTVKS